jgi:hypothetical protein
MKPSWAGNFCRVMKENYEPRGIFAMNFDYRNGPSYFSSIANGTPRNSPVLGHRRSQLICAGDQRTPVRANVRKGQVSSRDDTPRSSVADDVE